MGSPLAGQTVNLQDATTGVAVATGTTDASGNVTLSYSPTQTGGQTFNVVFNGQGRYQPSFAAAGTEQVNQDAVQTQTTITSPLSPNPGTVGQPVSISANLSTNP